MFVILYLYLSLCDEALKIGDFEASYDTPDFWFS